MRRDCAVLLVVGEPLLYLVVVFEEGYVAEVVAVLQWKGCECLSTTTRQRKEGSERYRWIYIPQPRE